MAQVKKKKTKNEYRTSMRVCFICAAFFLIIAGIYAAAHWNYMVMNKTVNLNEEIYEGKDPNKGDYVTLNVNLVLGNYAETKHRINGIIPIGTDEHYAVVLFDQEGNLYVMSLTVKSSSDIDALESMVNPTWDLLSGISEKWPTGISLTGRISTMDSEIRGYYKQQLSSANITTSDFKEIYELTLDATETRFSKFLCTGLLLLIGAGCIIGALSAKKKMKEVEDIQEIGRQNASDPSLNPFLNGGAGSMNPYNAGTDASNPYAASMDHPQSAGTDNAAGTAYGAAGAAYGAAAGTNYSADATNPYGTNAGANYGADASNPYGTNAGNAYGADASNPYGTNYGTDAENSYNAYTPDSASSDSYNSDSYTPN
ncbi:MAG: hypothetical protein IJM25_05865 [Eubacterium sp.]|nr:hypothetical protein [Eubacterium sp.]